MDFAANVKAAGFEQPLGVIRAPSCRPGRGSTFWLCELNATDPRFPKYPRLPVVACAGFTPGPDGEGDRSLSPSGSEP
jgi:hypothetical protein